MLGDFLGFRITSFATQPGVATFWAVFGKKIGLLLLQNLVTLPQEPSEQAFCKVLLLLLLLLHTFSPSLTLSRCIPLKLFCVCAHNSITDTNSYTQRRLIIGRQVGVPERKMNAWKIKTIIFVRKCYFRFILYFSLSQSYVYTRK